MDVCDDLVTGELYIQTPYVTSGYCNAPELTRQRYIQDPFSNKPDRFIYRTGDLAKRLPDGNIVFLGRIDRQVKIRGIRIEPGEIEHTLIDHPLIREAAIIKKELENLNELLQAYVVEKKENAEAEALSVDSIKAYLHQRLPDYMVPARITKIHDFPRNPNGKVNYSALKALEAEKPLYVPPENDVERGILKIWTETLNIEEIGITDNFFELGGNSLNIMSLIESLHKRFDVRVAIGDMFNHPTIRLQAQLIIAGKPGKYISIQPVEEREYYPLSSAQKRLYVLQQMDLRGTAYNMPAVIPLYFEVGMEKLETVFNQLIHRHESLRTSFHMLDREPVQKVHQRVPFKVEFYPAENLVESFFRPFDLTNAPLLRVGITRTVQNQHTLMVDMPHIISDGFSQQVLVRDFLTLYSGEPLPPLRLQYRDYARWQINRKESDPLIEQEAFWLRQFEDEIPILELPADYPRPSVRSFEGSASLFELSVSDTQALKTIALQQEATPYMVLLSIVNILLSKLSSQEDIVIGTPSAGRRHADLEKIIGMFVNTLPLRNYPAGETTFREFLRQVKEHTLQAFENQEYQFEDLVEKVSVNRDTRRNPLFDVMFALQNIGENPEPADLIHDEKRKTYPEQADGFRPDNNIARFDITLLATELERESGEESGDVLHFDLIYDTKLFKQETIRRFITYFQKIISTVVEEPHQRISEIEIIPAAEKNKLLFEFNNTQVPYPTDKTIHGLFEEQVEKNPDHIALAGQITAKEHATKEHAAITYRQLNEKSNQLACRLNEQGVATGSIAAIMTNRSLEMVIGIFGILKAGAAYLPIDPDYPRERIDFMLTDSGTHVLLTSAEVNKSGMPEVRLETNIILIDSPQTPEDSMHHDQPVNILTPSANLAYVIYTSGTTGRPKGVAVKHTGVVNMLLCRKEVYRLASKHISLQLFSSAFDGFVTSFFTPLISGAAVVLPGDEDIKNIVKLTAIIARHKVTHFICIPALYQLVIESLTPMQAASLEVVTLAGDRLDRKLLEMSLRKNKSLEIAVEYGVTEASVMSTIGRHLEQTPGLFSMVGKPVWNTRLFILDPPYEATTHRCGRAVGYQWHRDFQGISEPPRSDSREICENS